MGRWRSLGLPDGALLIRPTNPLMMFACRPDKAQPPSGISLHRSSLALAKQPQQRLNLLIQRGEILFHNQMQRRGAARAVVER